MGQGTYELDERLSYLSNRVAFAINERFLLKLQPYDLTIPMWRVLVVLHDRGEQKLIDLSGLTSIEGSTLSRLTEAMHDRKLIRKARSTRSKREIVISLRSSGVSLVEALIPEALKLETLMLTDMPEGDIATTRRVLKTMYSLLTRDSLPLGEDQGS
ncbi:MarR family transcriptional regulator [Mesorhizobium sp. AD1-1]|uniref:MarR family winged helix-turn-helix transcriptional regulator n=1 Tax=unclassified Mesorhizobium TaxID=325217 RepID=UPI001CCD800E|nr:MULTISPECIES: MarR family transcriptional regulator [unclassified Mesorhizobium]MBZ9719261.1 MarR family transcriptional regulator [Mesorhizobium sp. AD1-1]MCA0030449.1 MarR family transcriptional regulator [Mesorhizobium sp. B263B2A]